jgi:hypothetical protein
LDVQRCKSNSRVEIWALSSQGWGSSSRALRERVETNHHKTAQDSATGARHQQTGQLPERARPACEKLRWVRYAAARLCETVVFDTARHGPRPASRRALFRMQLSAKADLSAQKQLLAMPHIPSMCPFQSSTLYANGMRPPLTGQYRAAASDRPPAGCWARLVSAQDVSHMGVLSAVKVCCSTLRLQSACLERVLSLCRWGEAMSHPLLVVLRTLGLI